MSPTPRGPRASADAGCVFLLVSGWILLALLVNPLGDFPLNDDWVYGLAAKFLLEHGDIRFAGGPVPNLLSQVLWGGLFCLPAGFSFTALRISSLVLGLAGVLATYGLLREMRVPPRVSLCGASLVAVNPIYFALSNTFMTDVPFFAFFTLSLWLLARGLGRDSAAPVGAGLLLAGVALFVRQVGLVLPIAFGAAYLVHRGVSPRTLVRAFLPALGAVILQLAWQHWIYTSGRVPPGSNLQVQDFLGSFRGAGADRLASAGKTAAKALIYLGLFLVPYLTWDLSSRLRQGSRRTRLLGLGAPALFLLLLAAQFTARPFRMPVMWGTLYDFGIGPLTFRDAVSGAPNRPVIPGFLVGLWWLATAGGVAGACLLVQDAVRAGERAGHRSPPGSVPDRPIMVLVGTAIAAYFVPLVFLRSAVFDRYLLPGLPLWLAVVSAAREDSRARRERRGSAVTRAVMVVGVAAISLAAAHDYLSWNRAQWRALRDLTVGARVPAERVDGAHEFNWWTSFRDGEMHPDSTAWSGWQEEKDYVLGLGDLPGFEEIARYPCGRWLPVGPEAIRVLRRSEAGATRPELRLDKPAGQTGVIDL